MSSLRPSPETRARRIAVVGGGITGLAAAHRLIELSRQQGISLDVTLYESANRIGGVFGTLKTGDYLIETGADSFITNKPWAVDLCRRLGIEDRLIPTDARYRRSLVLRRRKPVPVPDGFLLMAPSRIGPILKSPLFSPLGKLRMGLEYFIPRKRRAGDESLGAFVRRRFGREALNRLVQPLVGGIYTSDPWKLSLEATMPRFLEMEQQHGSLIRAFRRQASQAQAAEDAQATGARYGLFATLAGGMSELLETLERAIAGSVNIRRNTAVAAIQSPSPEPATAWRLTLNDGSAHDVDGLILALRAPTVAGLVQPFDPALADGLRGIDYASSAIVVTGHKLANVRHPLDAFGLVVPYVEGRKILAVSFTSRKFPNRAPEGHVQLRTFVGGAMQPELMRKTDDQLVEIVQSELSDLLGVQGPPELAIVCRYQNAMPQYHVGHVGRVKHIFERAARHPGLALAGNAYQGVGIPDCIHSGEQAAERVIKELLLPPK